MRGKYTTYSLKLAATICARISAGACLHTLARQPNMPSLATLKAWLKDKPDFAVMYEAACDARAYDEHRRRHLAENTGGGRISTYSEEMAETICAHIAAGAAVRDLKAFRELPSGSTIYAWIGERPEFRRRYEAACRQRAELLAEEILDIADDRTGDYLEDKDGNLVPDRLNLHRARVMIDARKWRVAALAPKRYGPAAQDDDGFVSHEDGLDELD